jgi:hypothetical protein
MVFVKYDLSASMLQSNEITWHFCINKSKAFTLKNKQQNVSIQAEVH